MGKPAVKLAQSYEGFSLSTLVESMQMSSPRERRSITQELERRCLGLIAPKVVDPRNKLMSFLSNPWGPEGYRLASQICSEFKPLLDIQEAPVDGWFVHQPRLAQVLAMALVVSQPMEALTERHHHGWISDEQLASRQRTDEARKRLRVHKARQIARLTSADYRGR